MFYTDMEAPVIIHRWFEHGAGWAYSPALEEDKRELMVLLDAELKMGAAGKSRQRPIFQLPMSDGRLVLGCVVDDDRSLDVKAQGRRPTILRAAVLPPTLCGIEGKAIIDKLSEKWPEIPGQDHTLAVDLHQFTTATKKLSPQKQPPSKHESVTSRFSWPESWPSPMKLIIVVAILAAVWWEVASWRRSSSDEVSLQPLVKEMQNCLDEWGEKGQTQDDDAVIDHFFLFLSRQPAWGELPRSEHPYIKFVQRLPPSPAKPEGAHWTTTVVERALNELVDRLFNTHREADSHDGTALVRKISEAMNYDHWRAPSVNFFKPEEFADDPSLKIAKYVENLRRGSERDFTEAADRMKTALSGWKIDIGDSDHPFAVMRQFFGALRPPNFSARETDSEYGRFAEPFAHYDGSLGWTCDNQNELNYELKKLIGVTSLEPFNNTELTSGLVEKLTRQTKFEPSSDGHSDRKVPQGLVDFARKFNPSLR